MVLVRYGELALKSAPVRREFEHKLRRNIVEQFAADGIACRLRSDRGHLYVEADDGAVALRIVRRVFGVTSASEVWEVPTDRGEIERRLLELAEPLLAEGSTFAVRARRTGTHPFTSNEIARDLGAAVLSRYADRNLSVDLETPDVALHVEVRGTTTYLYFDRVRGPGGLPLGVAGRVVALVDGPRGALGAFLMMKRGCRTAVLVTDDGRGLADRTLKRLDPRLEILSVVPSDPVESQLEGKAVSTDADAVVLPIAVDEYGSARTRFGDRVVFSPTVGLSDEEVTERWRKVEELAA